MHPLWGSEVEHRDPTQKAVCGLSAQCDTYLAPRLGRGRVRRVLEPDPAAHWRKESGTGVWRLRLVHCHPRHLGTRRERKLLFFLGFGYLWLGSQWRNRTKRKQKILHPALLRAKEWCGHHLLKSRIQELRVARLRDAACPGAS